MECAEFQEIVHELARKDGHEILGEPLMVRARFHAETCESCMGRLAQAQAVARALETYAKDSEALESPAKLEARLIAVFRERRKYDKAAHGVRSFWAGIGRYERATLAAAAAAFLAFGVWNFSQRRSGHVKTSKSLVANVPNQSSTIQPPQRVSTGSSSELEAAGAGSDNFSGFVAVPYESGFGATDSGVIVRVDMPRSALAQMGYPIDVTRGNEMVRADVMVGDDGWPLAVRIVQ